MALKLMYITNHPKVARIAEMAGVDRIFVDMEYIGKFARQGGLDTVQSHHTLSDVAAMRNAICKAELLVRSNPVHDASEGVMSTEEEIDGIVSNGADIIMLPYFKTPNEVKRFLAAVGGRTQTILLVETPESVACIDDILSLHGIDAIHIGLNDLSLGYHVKFMFELLIDGTVEKLAQTFRLKGIPFGFGGIALPGKGLLPSEYVIREHYRLGSSAAILSRSFCDYKKVGDLAEIERIFKEGLAQIRAFETTCAFCDENAFAENYREIQKRVRAVCEEVK